MGSRSGPGRAAARTCAIFIVVIAWAAWAAPQTVGSATGSIKGRLVHGLTLEPVPDAPVLLMETRAETTSDANGEFVFAGLADGLYHVVVRAQGFAHTHVEVTVKGPAQAAREIAVDPELHYTEVVSVSPSTKDQFEAYQATSVLAGQDLSIQLQGTLSATVATQPGIAERGFGPGASRPVIRGFDGDRVVVLEDGQRMGDLSSQSGDHGVNVNPAAATRVEVVRGPATLLYGSNAIGGLVNVISDLIPTRPLHGTNGTVQADFGSGAREAGLAADVNTGRGAWVLHAGGATRRSGDVRTPDFTVENTQSASGLGNVGLAWARENAYAGGSYQYDEFKYGIPVIEDGQVELDPRRHAVTLRGERRKMSGVVESIRGTYGYRRYRHDEIVGGQIGTRFANDTSEFDLLANHRPYGRLTGTFGGWGLLRNFESTGEEALSPPVRQGTVAAFTYQEVTWPHATLQFGARYDHVRFNPQGGLRPRDFDNVSGSLGLLVRPTDATTVAVSVARAVRNPALEELYFFGPHPGNFAFEIGNDDLAAEKNLGLDVAFRWRVARFSGELSYFRNDVADYVFRNPITEEEFDDRFGHDAHGEGEGHDDEFPFVEFVGADSVLQGFEAHADVQVAAPLTIEVSFDAVRGELSGSGDPLPRIPPMRFMTGVRYHRAPFQAGADAVFAAKQDRVFGDETPTAGYVRLRAYAAYSFMAGGLVNTITARLDNATDELYRNHLSYIKDLVPEMGRDFRVVYSVGF
jgi:iron complex outermembrane receptor protein